MTILAKKRVLYILLFLGLVVVGGGIWMLAKSPPEIDIPEGNPVIYEEIGYMMRGQFSYLYFYEDGSILFIEEKGLRPAGGHPTRTWSTSKFTQQQLDNLLAYLENCGLDELDEHYEFRTSDMFFTISVNSDNLSKKVMASGYITPDNGETYPDMPSPLNEIYGRLRAISQATKEVYREDIKD